ncbi:MAG: sigma-70 family RNA polymerase sigma factor [Pseudomonadota bacterium]
MPRSRPSATPPASALYDEWLVIAARQGERRALERLHQRFDARLLKAARRLTGDGETARDLVQECWLAILRGLPGLRDPARFRAYAFGILYRRGMDHTRRAISARQHEALDTALPDAHASSPPDRLAIAQAFAKLSPDQRLAAHLHFIEGLTLREIAEVQSIALGTAKSRLFHARRKLKAALTEPT